MTHFFFIPTPLGELTVCTEGEELTRLSWERTSVEGAEFGSTPLIRETARQIQAYFERRLTCFSLPYRLSGSTFRKRVWTEMSAIPYGCTWSYQDLARHCQQEKACQAVGTACRENPLVLIIPCHRVINKNGATGNYYGGAERKRLLLELEKQPTTLFPLSVINL